MKAGFLTYLLLVCLFLSPYKAEAAIQSASERTPGMLLTSTKSESLMIDLRSALFSFDLENANLLIKDLGEQEDGFAAAQYHKCWSEFLLAMFEQTDSLANTFINNSDALLDSGVLDFEDPWGRLMQAELKLQQAFVHARQGRNLRAALAARRAFKAFENNLDRYPLHWDSYKGFGVLQIMIGSVPSSYRKLLSILGYEGTVDLGLRSLKLASEKAHYFQEEAKVILAMADLTVNQSKLGGGQIIDDLFEDDRNSPFLSLLQIYALQSDRKSREVIELADHLLEIENNDQLYVPKFTHYFLGDAYFKLNQFEEAIPHFQSFIDSFEGRALLSPALSKIGLAYDILGEREKAQSYYKKVIGDSEFDVDQFARKRASKYLDHPPEKLEIEILKATNLQDAGESGIARTHLLKIEKDTTLSELERTQVHYMLGRTFHHEGELAKAIEYYESTLSFSFDERERWIPWAAFYAGEAWEELGDLEQSRANYKRALNYKGDFSYKRSLEQKTKAAMQRVAT